MRSLLCLVLALPPYLRAAPLEPPAKQLGQFKTTTVERIAAQNNDPVLEVLSVSLEADSATVPDRPVEVTSFEVAGTKLHGLRATRDIAKDEIILSVGTDDIIISTRPHQDLWPIFYNCSAAVFCNQTMWRGPGKPFHTVWMAIDLLYQRAIGKKSHYHSYMETLPQSFSTPTQWTEEEVGLLNGTSLVYESIMLDKQMLKVWYRSLFPAVFKFAPQIFEGKRQFFTQEMFNWAFYCVETRAFGFRWEGSDTKALVPLVDMANHEYNHKGKHLAPAQWDFAEGKFVVVALVPFAAGSEVTISYGKLNNAHLLKHYGFTLANNPVEATPRPPEAWPSSADEAISIVSTFPTTLEEDMALCKAADTPMVQLNAARVRLDERLALLGMDVGKTAYPSFPSSWKTHKEAGSMLQAIETLLVMEDQ